MTVKTVGAGAGHSSALDSSQLRVLKLRVLCIMFIICIMYICHRTELFEESNLITVSKLLCETRESKKAVRH